jgi:membrane-associated protein
MNFLDPQVILESLGGLAVFGVALIIFLETSTIIGSFLPGDSLLFLLGLSLATWLASFPIFIAIPTVIVGAITGAHVGFLFGAKLGPKLFERDRGFFLNRNTAERTKEFWAKYGNRSIFLARFIPVLRALVPMFAAIGNMPKREFIKLNFFSAIIWVTTLMSLGFTLGQIEFVKKNIELMVITFAVISSLPLPFELLRERQIRRKAKKSQQ